MDIKVKISGITTQDAVSACLRNRVDYLGFVFHNMSPRNLSYDNAERLAKGLPDSVKKIAVLVNHDKTSIREIGKTLRPDYLQLDGDDTPEQIQELKKQYGYGIIKKIYVRNLVDLNEKIHLYEPFVDGFLFDAGNNREMFVEQSENTFDWGMLKKISTNKFWMIAGGITKYNVRDAIRMSGAVIVNASSTVESSPGIKDPQLIEEFIRIARS